MLALRRLAHGYHAAPRLASVRFNTTAPAPAAASAAASPPPPATTAKQPTSPAPAPASTPSPTEDPRAHLKSSKRRRVRGSTRRAFITPDAPREWCRPLAKGVEPAYDWALRYIVRDARALRRELEGVRAELGELEAAGEGGGVRAGELREKVGVLEIQSEANLPDVRWKARNGMADFSKPIYRHLVEQRWREEGDLDLLMERIYQMNVVPDLLPVLKPSLDMRIRYLATPPEDNYLRTRVKRGMQKVEPGVFLVPEQTRKAPEVYMTVFHTDTRLYTLLMVDLDVPHPENQTFTSYLHWLQPNIPLSATTTTPPVALNQHTRYVPPHPQQGTPYHRYVLLVLPQASPTEPIDVPVFEEADRLGFDFRAFADKYGLDGARGGGAHMFRSVWDVTVSHIYKHTLKKEEPRYGKMPLPDPYEALKERKKYI